MTFGFSNFSYAYNFYNSYFGILWNTFDSFSDSFFYYIFLCKLNILPKEWIDFDDKDKK